MIRHFPNIDKFDLIIGAGVTFVGDIEVEGRVCVSGQVTGRLQATDLQVDLGGRVDGCVRVDHLVVKGWIGHDIISRESTLVHSTGVVQGALSSDELEIERGGRVMARLRRPLT